VTGLFVAVDGPKNSGKTTVVRLLPTALGAIGQPVVLTKEPTPEFQLSNEERFAGRQLAELIARDRARHVQEVIEPGVNAGRLVITDRYIASALVFHRMDGVPVDELWERNRGFLLPDLNIIVTAEPSTLASRRVRRGSLTRFEREFTPEVEVGFYADAATRLRAAGVAVVEVANEDGNPVETARSVAEHIQMRLGTAS
jgi:dTMP kinase